ncbi:FRG domain-containing protein [Pseudomonas capsici]|uniref:FRG domain-containing protein n=1 Tax=Pseudomonas capsici TaxID=2810614 RepID=UPI0019D0C1F5|nr:FRG domain-containing protein [Pseudomonas capsici]MBN6717223.1 FRG domain-containing protein [Pseudomonas capsici]MBN6722124.1 FRG domain-containing protein [Pseudomonas capsici]MBN6727185.1 FRG domain-containing protein [Pseudomonas capsici]
MREITSVQSLLEALNEDNDGYKGAIWYRGQANLDWPLLPGYVRLKSPPSEATLLKRFKQSAAMLIERHPGESFDWLFLMQHYGVPTRLLDWSESPLVGLYFAVEGHETRENCDAALWLLRPSELNKHAHINNKDEDGYIPSFDDQELENYSVDSLAQNKRIQLLPVATIATRNNARIQAQLGVFTIHHHENIPIEKVGDSSHVIQYKIPKEAKPLILKQLEMLGFGRFQMFPELASVGLIIKEGVQ